MEKILLKKEEFPALFCASDSLSLKSQKCFFRALFIHLLLLTLITIPILFWNLEFYFNPQLLPTIFTFLALSCSIYMAWARPEKLWYSGRAVAESIKTLTWRFIIRAEPFNSDDEIAANHFSSTLSEIYKQNIDFSKNLYTHLDRPQLTEKMISIRQLSFEDRKQFYINARIKDQQKWYAKRAKNNSFAAKVFFGILIFINFSAMIFSIIKISRPEFNLPVDIFVALAGGTLTWLQTKRFSELSASYSLAAHEISLINDKASYVKSENDFSSFVADAEKAFSREHTQWAARRDI